MGANFETLVLDGNLTANEVREAFQRAQDDDRYENGHSYSGGFGMADGLKFAQRTFKSRDEAYDFLDATCQKWHEAQAVTFAEGGKAHWMIGACCAS